MPKSFRFAASFGVALLTKFSALLLLPIVGLLALIWVARAGAGWRPRARRAALALGTAAVVGYLAIWAGYGLRFQAATDPDYSLDWEVVGLKEGPAAEAVELLLSGRLLPEGYLYGLAYFLGGAALAALVRTFGCSRCERGRHKQFRADIFRTYSLVFR